MTELTERQVAYLETALRRIEVFAKDASKPQITLAARREAAILHLNLNGYRWDYDNLKAIKK